MDKVEIRRRPTYPVETRVWAVAMARAGQHRQADIARLVGCNEREIRRWLTRADIEEGVRPGLTSAERRELSLLRRTVQRQQEHIHLLEEARGFFATETR